MKTDARTRYTKKVIREAFFFCLAEKPLREVTVKAVCDRAEINRATFYRYYRDCYDLLDRLEQEMLSAFREILLGQDRFSRGVIDGVLAVLESNRDLTSAIVNGQIADGLRRKMTEIAWEICRDDWEKRLPKASETELELLFSALSSAVFQIIVGEYGNHDRRTLVDFSHRLITDCTARYAG